MPRRDLQTMRRRTRRWLRLWAGVLITAGLLVVTAGLIGLVLALHQLTNAPLAWALGAVVGIEGLAVVVFWRSTRVR